ncbi:unnamed protein product [Linum tenue]|uniref:MADS-box domain-containing protein n=1 Tax=Linum tenue TaxID=586396 RepID=A0AAV0QDN3_9ROSI|nr:unnamed protein product [Linum tenue]
MKKIEKESDMIITFSKRKSGIFKKVHELITLTGNKVGFLVFSPAGKPFSFGHPSFNDIVLRYLGQQTEPQLQSYNGEMFMQARIQELNETHNSLLDLMEEQNQKDATFRRNLEGKPLNNWWNKGVEEIQVGELSDLEYAYSDLLARVEKRRMEIVNLGNYMTSLNVNMNGCFNASSAFAMHPYHHIVNMGSIATSPVQRVDQRLNMMPTMMTTTSNYSIVGQMDGGINNALDHPSSSFEVLHSNVFGYGPKPL